MGIDKSLHHTLPRFPCFILGAVCVSFPEAIRRKVELEWGTEDEEYLEKVERNVRRSLQEHLPDVVVYNAGTDVLEGDRLGGLSISPAVRPSMRSPEDSPVAWPQSDYIISHFSVVVRESSDKHGNSGQRAHFNSQFLKQWGCSWQGSHCKEHGAGGIVRKQRPHFICTQEAEREQEVGPRYKM